MSWPVMISFIFICIGFWPSDSCSSEPPDSRGTAYRLWRVKCDDLDDIPEKNLFLRDYNPKFFIETNATFECSAGYELPNKVSVENKE